MRWVFVGLVSGEEEKPRSREPVKLAVVGLWVFARAEAIKRPLFLCFPFAFPLTAPATV